MKIIPLLPNITDAPQRDEQVIFLPVYDRIQHQISANDVVMIKGDGNYTLFYFSSGKKMMVSKTLKKYEALLGAHSFVRIHKSFLINLRHLEQYDEHHEEVVTLKNGLRAEVSRRRKKEFQEKAQSFFGRKAV
ncbi:MAG: LytTR family transcriptional regulator [Cytophagaceae bacterium]|nr:LytTR family transcriptional regulator [Cytophagaceae bacterium]